MPIDIEGYVEDFIEEESHELWREFFDDMRDKAEAYFRKAIEKKLGNKICLQCKDIYDEEIDTAIDNAITDFVQSLSGNLEEIETNISYYLDSLEDASECYEEDEEKWEANEDSDINLGLDDV
jgi:hypothetical protein